MIGKITLIFMGLFAQEAISMNVLIFATRHVLYPVLLIHTLFVVGTIIDILFGFWFGLWLKRRTVNTKISGYIQKTSDRFSLGTKRYRRWLALLLLGNFSLPYINACIAGYLEMPFWESLFFIFVGNVASYVITWLIVIGVSSVTKNLYIAFAVVVIIAIGGIFLSRKLHGDKI